MDPRLSRRHTSALPPPLHSPASHTPRAPRASLNLGPRQSTPGLGRPPPFHSPRVVKHSRKSSLLDDKLDPHHVTLKQREDLVRPNAVLALERLLEAGNDEAEGPVRLFPAESKLFRAFESKQSPKENSGTGGGADLKFCVLCSAAKEVHLSDSTFLDPTELAQNPDFTAALSNPSSALSLIVTVSNLVTFLHLILDSAPSGPNNSRPARVARTVATRLQAAAEAFIPFIIPGTRPLSNALIKFLITLRQQQFIALLEASPSAPVDAQTFWSAPFGHFAATDRLGHRSSERHFKVLQGTALQQVESSGGDLSILRSDWEWDDVVREVVAFANGVAPGVLSSLAETQGPPSSIGEASQEEEDVQEEEEEAEVEGEIRMADDGRTPLARRVTLSPPRTVASTVDSDEDEGHPVKGEDFEGEDALAAERSSFDDGDDVRILNCRPFRLVVR